MNLLEFKKELRSVGGDYTLLHSEFTKQCKDIKSFLIIVDKGYTAATILASLMEFSQTAQGEPYWFGLCSKLSLQTRKPL